MVSLNTISIIIACAGMGISMAVFIYVKFFASKDIERTLMAKQAEMRGKDNGNDLDQSRVGIEPRKDKITKQKSSRVTGSESSYFVSYFGMAFQNQKVESTKVKAPQEGKVEDEENRRSQLQPITVTQGEEQYENIVNGRTIEEAITPPTDGESCDPSFESYMTGTLIKVIESSSGNSTDSGLSTESRKNTLTPVTDNLMKSEMTTTSNPKPITYKDQYTFNEEEDDDYDSLQLSKSDDNGMSTTSKSRQGEISPGNSEDNVSFVTPDQFPYDEEKSTESELSQTNKNSPSEDNGNGNSNPISSTLANVVKFMNDMNRATILERKNNSIDEVLDEDINKLVQDYDAGLRKIDKSSSLENPSYFSSDDERSSTIDLTDYHDQADDDIRYTNSDEQLSLQRFMVEQIDSSLTIPDLAGSGSDSGDWELSSSSEDRSQISSDKKGRAASNDGEAKDFIDCIYCHKKFNAEEGVRFSFDERCKHLLCEQCCEEGRAAQFNGECPECHFRQNVPRIPRAGQQTKRYRPDAVIMSI